MERRHRLCFVLAMLAIPAVALAERGTAESSSPCTWVLDSGAQELVCLALPPGERLAVLKLDGDPEFLVQSPDGSRLVVLDPGPGKDKGESGYAAKGRSAATIVDAFRREIVARVELGAGIDGQRYYFSPDARRLTLLCPGFEDENPVKSLPREVVNLDVVNGVETGRATLEHGTVPIGTDGRTLALMRGLNPSSIAPFGKGRLWIVDLEGPEVVGTVDTGGWFNLAASGPYVYLLHKGWPSRNAAIHRNGTLHVYSLERRALESVLDVGNDPKGIFRDEQGGRLFITSDAPRGARDDAAAELRVVRASTIAATLEVAANPRLVTRVGETLFVLGEETVTLVDPTALQVTATIPLRSDEGALVDDDDVPTELRLTSDERRAFVLYGLHNKVVVLDLKARAAVGSASTGRRRKGLFTGLASAFVLAGLYPGWQGNVLTSAGVGIGLWNSHLESGKATTPSMLAVGPDGLAAYAVNSQGRNVSVIDAATAERLEQIGVRGHVLRMLSGGHTLAVLSRSEIHLIDTATNERLDELDVPDLRDFATTPDGRHAVAVSKGSVTCIDSATGEVEARLTDFERPVGLAFERAAGGQE